MKRYEILGQIANGIQAANKIRNVRNSKLLEDTTSSVQQSDISVLSEIINIIADHSPGEYNSTLKETLQKSRLYVHTYRDLKHHLDSTKSQEVNKHFLVKTLEIVKPALDNRSKMLIDKIVKINEIINS